MGFKRLLCKSLVLAMMVQMLGAMSLLTVFAGSTFTVVSCSIADSATNVPMSIGKINVSFSGAVDAGTINGTNITVTEPGGSANYGVEASGEKAVIKFAMLKSATVYTVTLGSGIKDSTDSISLTPKTFTFTTAESDVIFSENFTNSAAYPINASPGSGGSFYYNQSDSITTVDDGTKKWLKLANKVGNAWDETSAARWLGGVTDDLVYDGLFKFNAVGSETFINYLNGKNAAGTDLIGTKYMAQVSNGSLFVDDYSGDNLRKTRALVSNIQLDTTYKIRVVFKKGTDGFYRSDAYIDNGSGYVKKISGALPAPTTGTNNLVSINAFYALGVKDDTQANTSIISGTDLKLYRYLPTQYLSSNIMNGQTGFNGNTITLKFNKDMTLSDLNANVKLVDHETSSSIPFTGSYDNTTYTYTMALSQEALAQGGIYDVKFAGVTSADGFTLDGSDTINFTTGTNFGLKAVVSGIANPSSVPVNIGMLTVTFDTPVDPATVNSTSVRLKDGNGNDVKGGVVTSLSSDNKTATVKFGKLEYAAGYNLNLSSGITSLNHSLSLRPQTVTFTTSIPDIYYNDFEKYNVNTTPTDAHISGNSNYATILSESGSKYLRLTNPPVAGNFDEVGISVYGAWTNPVGFDFKIRTNGAGLTRSFGKLIGDSWSNTMELAYFNTNPNRWVLAGSVADLGNRDIFNLDTTKFYHIKVSYLLDSNSKYYANISVMNDSGNWVLTKSHVQPLDTSKVMSSINDFNLVDVTSSGSDGATMDVDDMKVYSLTPAAVLDSSITNGSTGVSVNPGEITLKFDQDMDSTTLGSIVLKSGNTTILTEAGTYNPNTRSITVQVYERLLNGTNYTLDLSGIKTMEGLAGTSNINFTTTALPVEITGVTFSATPGGTAISKIAGNTSVYANVNLKKNTSGDFYATVIVALYDDQKILRSLAFTKKAIVGSSMAIYDVGLSGIASAAGWFVKAFVWEGDINNCKPLLDSPAVIPN